MTVQAKLLSALVKVFPDETPHTSFECQKLTALRGDAASFQIAYFSDETANATISVEVKEIPHREQAIKSKKIPPPKSPLDGKIVIRSVEYVPSEYPGDEKTMQLDGNYIRTKPCSFPDILRALPKNRIKLWRGKYRTLWIDIETDQSTKSGVYSITVVLKDLQKNELCRTEQILTIYNASLPDAALIHTEWFHSDCLADYYGFEVFSDEYWRVVGNFMATAAKRGINTVLTPVFTPPLDTAVGQERRTVQLVDISLDNAVWKFSFEKLEKWVDTAFKNGIQYFEISQFFTQWGALAAPKIMASVDGEYKRVFGWDTPADSPQYPAFLREFLPALTEKLREMKISGLCYFHISDEPDIKHEKSYMHAKTIVEPFLTGFKIIDAISDYRFYSEGLVSNPVVASNEITPFLENKVPSLWTYYCVAQGYKVSNRFMAMSLARVRALGIQLFKYKIAGFLHWGYNFYNTQYSAESIDPYKVTDAGGKFPSGDAFAVYPGEGGIPEESIRLMALNQAQTDLRALTALEKKTSYEKVIKILEEDLPSPITFESYPQSEYYYIRLRNRVNAELNVIEV